MALKAATLKWTQVGDVLIVCSTSGTMPEQGYDQLMKAAQSAPIKKMIALNAGTTEVNSVQRKQAAELNKAKGLNCAVVTDDRLVRGIVTAVSWLGGNLKPFSWSNLRDAVRYLKVSPNVEEEIVNRCLRLKDECLGEATRTGA